MNGEQAQRVRWLFVCCLFAVKEVATLRCVQPDERSVTDREFLAHPPAGDSMPAALG